MRSVAGHTALVTGATGGLGQAISRRLAAAGAKVVVTGRRQEAVDALADELGGRGVVAELSDPASVRQLLAEAGEIDILVANAALTGDGPLDSYDGDELRAQIDVNLTNPIELTRAVMPAMRDRGNGHLVYISSVSGYVPTPMTTLYAATKFGLRGFAHSLRQELHGTGVGVSVIYPGPISGAGMWAKTGLESPPGMSTKTPEDVAEAVHTAIVRDRLDVVVASWLQRAGIPLYSLFPNTVAAIMRVAGGHEIVEQVAAAHRPEQMQRVESLR